MKKTLLGLSLMLVTPAFASQALFEALDVTEEMLPSPRMEQISRKSIGGLTCLKSDHTVNGLSFNCEADVELLNSEVLYKGLKLEEVVLPTPRSHFIFEKSAGNLTCQRMNIGDEDNFSCKIKF